MVLHRWSITVISVLLFGSCAGLMRLTPDHIRARQYIQKGQWDSASVLLEREVQRNPSNHEAWYDLGAVRKELGDIEGMVEAYSKAEPGISEERRRALPQIYYIAWAEHYNTAADMYNRSMDNRDTAGLARARQTVGNAIKLKPEVPENYDLLGRIEEHRGDTTAALAAYARYDELLNRPIEFAKQTGLSLGLKRDKVIELFGPPLQSRTNRTTAGDTTIVDKFVRGSDTVYISSFLKSAQGAQTEGWRLNPPPRWTNDERFRYSAISVGPYIQRATIYYNRRDYTNALSVLDRLVVLIPGDETVQNFRIQIYRDQGKLNEALAQLQQLVQNEPPNKIYLSSYALVLLQMERYDDAVAQYDKVLQIDPTYDIALFNAAAALKNRAAQIQREERERKDRDAKYKENEQRYFPLLIKAADYFDRYRRLPEHRNDLTALEHMVNIYETVRDRDRLKQIITELEAFEAQYGNESRYWELLGGIYARNNQVDKAERAYKRADLLRRSK